MLYGIMMSYIIILLKGSEFNLVKDLSLNPNSATSVYIRIIPELEQLKTSDMTADDRIETARDLVISSLCKARMDCTENRKGISQDYIVKVRMIISKYQTINQIINYLNNAINIGKNYEKETN